MKRFELWTRSGADPVRVAVKVVKYLAYVTRIEEKKQVGESEANALA